MCSKRLKKYPKLWKCHWALLNPSTENGKSKGTTATKQLTTSKTRLSIYTVRPDKERFNLWSATMALTHGESLRTSLSLQEDLALVFSFIVSMYSLITYDRQTLLDLQFCVYMACPELDPVFSMGDRHTSYRHKQTWKWRRYSQHTRKWGSWGGLLVWLRCCPA